MGGDDLVKAVQFGAGEMAKWFRALTVPPKDLHLIPSTNVTPHSRLTPLPGDLLPFSDSAATICTCYMGIRAGKTIFHTKGK